MRFLATLAAALTMLVGVPALAQDPIAEAIEAIDNYDSDGAKTILDTACKAGNAEACWRLALIMAQDYSDEAKAAADKQFLANCARGDPRSCYMINRRVAYDGDEKAKAKGATALRKACDGGLGYACADLAFLIEYPGDDSDAPNDTQQKEIAGLYEKACSMGIRHACHAAANRYGNTYGNPLLDYPKAIAMELKACEMGAEDACSNLPDLERNAMGEGASPTVEQRVRWAGFRKRACELGGSNACESMLTEQLTTP